MTGSEILRADVLTRLPGVSHGFETRGAELSRVFDSPALRLRQVHGAESRLVDEREPLEPLLAEDLASRPAGDALVTGTPGLLLAVATADCVPVLVADPTAPAIAAIHAGWRGLALGVIPSAVAMMVRELGADPGRCAAAIGPRVGADSYRVGHDVRVAFLASGLPDTIFAPAGNDDEDRPTWWCDLAAAARMQLVACGIPDGGIDTLDACTVRDRDRFWSYRRQGEAAGRMLSGLRIDASGVSR